jgi:hypothetical protein
VDDIISLSSSIRNPKIYVADLVQEGILVQEGNKE